MYCIVVISNAFFKYCIFKPIYSFFNKDKLPLLGFGSRPKSNNLNKSNKSNKSNCNFEFDFDFNIFKKSYGMPSGHSQIAWSISTYLICKIINHIYKSNLYSNKSIIKLLMYLLSIIILLIISIYISYGRVFIENCHTIQQVIIGGIIGCICGFLIYYYEDKIIKLF